MQIKFYELDKAKRAAKALMYGADVRESDYSISVCGSLELNGNPVFGGIKLFFNGKNWVADVDGREYKDSEFYYTPYTDFYLVGP